MIPHNIDASHILQAIEKAKGEGYDSRREATDYNLYFEGQTYPPKVIISYANIFANGAHWPSTSFGGGAETNNFLIQRGFPILCNEHKNPEGFFTDEELQFFDRYANKPYDYNDPVLGNAGDFISRYIWGRTKTWADNISQVTDFKREGRISWNEQRNNTTGQAFKAYSWYRLHHSVHHHEKIFYTVGVDGPPLHGLDQSCLLIKLDCYRSKMTVKEQDAFDGLLKTQGVERLFIELPDNELKWEWIINLSKRYIDSTFETYLAAIELAEANDSEMAARITWNSLGWVKPSGRVGKSVSRADTQEKRYGYTPEEWLFDLEKIIDGFHYARIEAVNADHHIGKVYNLTLFAHDAKEKQWFWIARIQNAEVINPKISEQISQRYLNEKWFEEQTSQLDIFPDVGSMHYMQIDDTGRFNVRFRPEDVLLYDYEPFGDTDEIPSNHYNLPALRKPPEFTNLSDNDKTISIKYGSEKEDKLILKIKKKYTARLTELENVHRKVQAGFARYLRERTLLGHKIYTESFKTRDRTRIDILEVTDDDRHIFYEVKTYPNCRHSIRAAVGQLLEYAYFPDECLANEFVIVSHLPAGQIELKYLNHLSKQLGIILRYVFYDHLNHRVLESHS